MIRKFEGKIYHKSKKTDHLNLTRLKAIQRAKILRMEEGFEVRLLKDKKTGLYDLFVRKKATQA